jgi:hypothetical protein
MHNNFYQTPIQSETNNNPGTIIENDMYVPTYLKLKLNSGLLLSLIILI